MTKMGLTSALICILLQGRAACQPEWQFTRQAEPGLTTDSAAWPIAGDDEDQDFNAMTGANLVFSSSSATASDNDPPGTAFASSTGAAEALNEQPPGHRQWRLLCQRWEALTLLEESWPILH